MPIQATFLNNSNVAYAQQATLLVQRGAFDLGSTVYPIAIKYNKIFVDAFWNSRKQSFTNHLARSPIRDLF